MSPVKKRTEEEILTQTGGIKVVLGGKAYVLPPPVIRKAKLFRQHIAELSSELAKLAQVSSDKPEEFEAGIKTIMFTMPDKVLDLFFEYAGAHLDRETIENTATEAELADAFGEVMKQAFPLSVGLVRGLSKGLGGLT